MGIVILLIIIFISLFSILAFNYCSEKRTAFIVENSVALQAIRAINAKFSFVNVPCLDMVHYYDNKDYYDIISPGDYLTYQLVYKQQDVLHAINCAAINNKNLSAYHTEIATARTLGRFIDRSNQEALSWIDRTLRNHWLTQGFEELCNEEKTLFEKEIITPPVTTFTITVTLFRTDLQGKRFDRKVSVFYTPEILETIKQLNNKYNGRYADPGLWQAICRVERGRVSNKMRFAVYNRDGNRCRRCGSPNNLEVDHIYPVSKGGKSTFENLQTLCHNCNTQKSNIIEPSAIVLRGPQNHPKGFCINCGIPLVKRHSARGEFWGCPNYPKCRYTSK